LANWPLLALAAIANLPAVAMAKNRKSSAAPRAREGKRQVICILSRKKSLYSTRRLVQAAKEQGHRPVVLDTLKCNIVVQEQRPEILYGIQSLAPPSVVIPRIGASITAYGLAVVNQFDMMGVPVLNNSVPIARSRDKLRCLQLLSHFGIPVPKTVMAHQRTAVHKLLEEVGGLPVIVKLLQGTQGIGVMIATTLEEAQTLLSTFWDLGHDVLVQQIIQESLGRDVRAFVVGDRVVAAMRRTAKEGEFRSNIHRGGEGAPIELSDEVARTAVSAARIVGLEVAGVDMLEGRGGPLVLEVNSSPGFEGIEAATRLDVAGTIVRHAVQFALDQKAGVRRQRVI
jgi:ribosomal protein S6--L-glutamate ligase